MAFDKSQLENLIEETLKELGLYSPAAVALILGTIAQESAFGKFIRQLGNGPALGICQMEPATHDDIWKNYLRYRGVLAHKIRRFSCLKISSGNEQSGLLVYVDSEELIWNLKYAIAMCRVHYLRVPEALPQDLEGQAAYWKKYYNTHLGKGTTEEYIKNYQKHIS